MLEDVVRLSNPEFNGRLTGTADDLQSGILVAERFQALGLQPAGNVALPGRWPFSTWAMTVPVLGSQIGGQAHLEFSFGSSLIPARLASDYLPVLDSPSAKVSAPVVFVGYGISDPARGFDEYAGVDVRDRVVLFLRGKPDGYPAPVTQENKVRVARDRGAIAFLTVTGPVLSPYEARRGMVGGPMGSYVSPAGFASADRPLPGCWISTDLAEKILSTGGRSLREMQELLNRTLAPRSVMTEVVARLAWHSQQAQGTLNNILGLIPASSSTSPSDGSDTVVIGAHRDHLGRQADLLFPGADDNASGTAVLLEVARALAQSGTRAKRAILFVSFSGEEQGLLGSRLYVKNPVRPLKTTVAMVNVDHAGAGNGRITVGVNGLPKDFAVEAGELAGLKEKVDVFGFFPGGDHVPFAEAAVPTFAIVSSGAHPNFHQPSDTADAVNPEILEAVARYASILAWKLANQ